MYAKSAEKYNGLLVDYMQSLDCLSVHMWQEAVKSVEEIDKTGLASARLTTPQTTDLCTLNKVSHILTSTISYLAYHVWGGAGCSLTNPPILWILLKKRTNPN